ALYKRMFTQVVQAVVASSARAHSRHRVITSGTSTPDSASRPRSVVTCTASGTISFPAVATTASKAVTPIAALIAGESRRPSRRVPHTPMAEVSVILVLITPPLPGRRVVSLRAAVGRGWPVRGSGHPAAPGPRGGPYPPRGPAPGAAPRRRAGWWRCGRPPPLRSAPRRSGVDRSGCPAPPRGPPRRWRRPGSAGVGAGSGRGDGDTPPLPAGQGSATLPHHGVQRFGQCGHEPVSVRDAQGRPDLLLGEGLGGIGPVLTEGDVLGDGVLEDESVLRHQGNI